MIIEQIKKDFPILNQPVNGHPLVYLDNAATSQKPQVMIDAIVDYYSHYNSNVHRGIHTLSQKATDHYEAGRDAVKEFLHAKHREEIIFTKNDTESLNLLAYSYGLANLDAGSEIILSSAEHHSNIVPWQLIAKKTGAQIRFVGITDQNTFDYDHFRALLNDNTKIVSISQGSNVTGEIVDFSQIISAAHSHGAIVIADAGQTAGHFLTNLDNELQDIDFVTFSPHKVYGPTGLGVLYGKREHLEKMEPMFGGGDMIKEVYEDYSTWNDLPYKFEAGTPNIADVIGFKATLDYIKNLDIQAIKQYEHELTQYTLDELKKLDFIDIFSVGMYGKPCLSIVAFNVKGVHSHDVGTILDEQGIAIRTGHHCAQPLTKKLGQIATARASLAMYNTREDIDKLIQGLYQVKSVFLT